MNTQTNGKKQGTLGNLKREVLSYDLPIQKKLRGKPKLILRLKVMSYYTPKSGHKPETSSESRHF